MLDYFKVFVALSIVVLFNNKLQGFFLDEDTLVLGSNGPFLEAYYAFIIALIFFI